jgi:hypothetical protein
MAATAAVARPRSAASTETASKLALAGMTPWVGMTPSVGLMPTMPLSAAGTRTDPAVSVPTPMSAMPSATATAEPELEPPATSSGSRELRTAP